MTTTNTKQEKVCLVVFFVSCLVGDINYFLPSYFLHVVPSVLDVGDIFLQVLLLFNQNKTNHQKPKSRNNNNTDNKTVKTPFQEKWRTFPRNCQNVVEGINSSNQIRKQKRKFPEFSKTQLLFCETQIFVVQKRRIVECTILKIVW